MIAKIKCIYCFGAGREIIRTPLNPDKTYSDDPLRMFRAIRFSSQLNFDIESKSFESFVELQ